MFFLNNVSIGSRFVFAGLTLALAGSVNATLLVNDRAFVFEDLGLQNLVLNGLNDDSSAIDLSFDSGFAVLRPIRINPNADLIVNNSVLTLGGNTFDSGGVLDRAAILATPVYDGSPDPLDTYKSKITVENNGSINLSAVNGIGNIILDGKSDLDITSGGKVTWTGNNCTGAFDSCDVRVGRYRTSSAQHSNSGILIEGAGSELDASNTGGGFFIGGLPGVVDSNLDPNVDGDFLAVVNGGSLKTNDATIAEANHSSPSVVGEVRATVIIDNASWAVTGVPGDGSVNFNVGEEGGRADQSGSANIFIQNGGQVSVTALEGQEAGLFVGQTVSGDISNGSNLIIIDGAGSSLTVDDNSAARSGSRIANGFVSVQNDGRLELDSTILLVSGNSGAALSDFNNAGAANPDIGPYTLSNYNLDVKSGGSVIITDNDTTKGLNALIIGQTPGAAPTESAAVRVTGAGSNITVDNDSGVKLALDATDFGIPVVSNIGTGILTIEDGGSVNINNGDFVIGARAGDNALVQVNGIGSSLTADRVIVGLADFEGAAVDSTNSGSLILNEGTINGDVIIDDNGILAGIGTINGTLFAAGGVIAPGFSPGTINVENFILQAGAQLLLEIGINNNGDYDFDNSDKIVASGNIDLSMGEVIIQLIDAETGMELDDLVTPTEILNLFSVLETGGDPSSNDFMAMDFSVTGATSSIKIQIRKDGETINAARIPLPSTLLLFGLGLAALRITRRKKA